ncbi:MAG: FAD-dependent monooxygenase, partial [Acidimicrobiia bacterium]
LVDVPVLVVGAGPVGLATAIALRLQGGACVVVEKHPSTLDYPKGRGISTRSMEIFRQWGIEDDVTSAGLPREGTEFFYLGETLLAREFRRFDRTALGRVDSPTPTERLICAQDLVEAILLRRARALGAEVRFDTEVVAVEDDGDAVTVTVRDRHSGARRAIAADYVVAADGGRSTVRAALGIGTAGPGVVGESVSILVEADLAERVADRHAIIYKVNRPHASAFFAVVDNHRRWLLMMARDQQTEPDEAFTDERCLELVRAALGDNDVPVRLLGHRFFQPTALVADRFRAGRVFLVGDAAHLTTPFGALGMNCGIADAHNLAWKLAGVLHGWAADALLETYDAERRPVARATSDASVLREDISAGPPRAAFAGITLGYRYESAATIPDGTPEPEIADPIHDYRPAARPGCRAPHVWVEHRGKRLSTLDLFGEQFIVLADDATDRSRLQAELAATRVPAAVYAFGDGGDLIDIDNTWRAAWGVEPRGIVLVRPDGHVAWRSTASPSPDATQTALRRAAGWTAAHTPRAT